MQPSEERRAPGAHRQQSAEEDDGIDVETPSARPVRIRLQVQPERELVQRERRAHPEADRHQPAEEDGKRCVEAPQVQQPAIAHQQQNQNSPDQVMNVVAMHHHPLEVSLMLHDSVDEEADSGECEQEGDRGDEHAPPRTVGDGGADQESQPRQLQQDQQQHNNQAGKGQQQQRSGSGHNPYSSTTGRLMDRTKLLRQIDANTKSLSYFFQCAVARPQLRSQRQ